MKKILTVTASDCSGAAGIQADIKTVTVHRMDAECVITGFTEENSPTISPDYLLRQFDCVFASGVPDAVKIGEIADTEQISIIADKLSQNDINCTVIDASEITDALIQKLLPLASVIITDIKSASRLSGTDISSHDEAVEALKKIRERTEASVLIKCGQLDNGTKDLLYVGKMLLEYPSESMDAQSVHGAGTTLATAIACNMADGFSVEMAVRNAKSFLAGAVRAGFDSLTGTVTIEHAYNISRVSF